MKKITSFIGLVSVLLVFIGVVFKVMHWPGASICLVLGGGLFAICYSPMLLLDKNKLAKTMFDKFVNIKIMLVMSILMISFIFKIMHWPGAGIGIYVGHLLLVILIPFLLFRGIKESDPIKKMNFKNESYFLILLTAFSLFVWVSTISKDTLKSFVNIENNINNTNSLVLSNNNLTFQAIQNSGYGQMDKIEKIRSLGNEMFSYIKELKNEMLMMTEEFKDSSVLDTLNLKDLKALGNKDIPMNVLFAGDYDNLSKGEARKLRTKLEEFNKALIELAPEKARENLNLGLNTDSVKFENYYLQWERVNFFPITLIGSLTELSKLQLDVRIAEATVINIIAAEIMKAQFYEIHKLKNPKDTL